MATADVFALTAEAVYNSCFDDADADLIIRAGDKALFRVYKVILKKASSIFKDMLSIPQSPSIVDDRDEIDGIPVIDVDEPERILEILFTLCYPKQRPQLTDTREAALTLKAALKYEMDVIAEYVRDLWPAVAATEPLRAFAVACSSGLHEQAVIAARLSLQEPVWPLEPPLAPEFRCISADTLLRLESYHRKCGAAARKCASDVTWCGDIFDAAVCKHCRGQNPGDGDTTGRLRLRDWYNDYTKRAAAALMLQPSGCTAIDERLAFYSMPKLDAAPCSMSHHSFEHMRQAIQVFGNAIDEVIDKIKLDLEF
ncbi:hypothetical protein BC835DRAFT_1309017 [Cytidiella melzeri]|nr:hypothetical protein BC835DRAFT_1309017 [Cytidiella melzeri]